MQRFFFRVLKGASVGAAGGACDSLTFQVVDFDRLFEQTFTYEGCGTGNGTPASIVSAGQFAPAGGFKHDTRQDGRRLDLPDVAGSACLHNRGGGDDSETFLTIGRGFGTIKLDAPTVGGGISETCGQIRFSGGPGPFNPKDINLDPGGA